jgi:hypothetical protein
MHIEVKQHSFCNNGIQYVQGIWYDLPCSKRGSSDLICTSGTSETTAATQTTKQGYKSKKETITIHKNNKHGFFKLKQKLKKLNGSIRSSYGRETTNRILSAIKVDFSELLSYYCTVKLCI